MRIITCVGYYATGSSAVKDLCREYSNCDSIGDYELRFVQDPKGISDLEYNIVENNHRHNTSNAIKDYLKLAKFYNGDFYTKRYRKYFCEDFMKITQKYIDDLVQLESKAWWHYDQYNRGKIFYFFDILYGKFVSIFRKGLRKSFLSNKEKGYYTYMSKEEFYRITQEYTDSLMKNANKNNTPFLMAEQLVSPSNVNRYLNYFKDIKVIIIERDPRDLYIACNEVYREGIVPVSSVEDFCKWYRITREHRKHEPMDESRALLVNFEDMIYNYDITTDKIAKFVGLDEKDHINKLKHFNPNLSIRGTKLFDKYPKYAEDVKYIEENLAEYIYDYEKVTSGDKIK